MSTIPENDALRSLLIMRLTTDSLSIMVFRFLIDSLRESTVLDAVNILTGSFRGTSSSIRFPNCLTFSTQLASRAVLGVLALMFLVPSAFGQGLVDEAEALAGLPGLYIVGGDVDESLYGQNITKSDLLAGVTGVLEEAGVPILGEMDWLMIESAPVVNIDLKSEDGVFRLLLEVLYLVHPVSSPDETSYAIIWSRDKLGTMSDHTGSEIITAARELAAELANDFRANM